MAVRADLFSEVTVQVGVKCFLCELRLLFRHRHEHDLEGYAAFVPGAHALGFDQVRVVPVDEHRDKDFAVRGRVAVVRMIVLLVLIVAVFHV